MKKIGRTDLFLLGAIVLLFVLKNTWLATLVPFFQGPDEQIHYATIEHRSEPEIKDWPTHPLTQAQDAKDIRTYGLSEETVESARILQFDEVKGQKENTQTFSDTPTGVSEAVLLENNWKRYNDKSPANTSMTRSWYYTLAAELETYVFQRDFSTRFLSLRFFSTVLGAIIVGLAYYAARRLNFSSATALAFSMLVAFQPMFSFMAAVINIDIALYLSFALFALAGIILLKEGASWTGASLLGLGTLLGITAKGPGLILVFPAFLVLAYVLYKKCQLTAKQFCLRVSLLVLAVSLLAALIIPKSYFIDILRTGQESEFSSPLESLATYLGKTMDLGEFRETTTSYWGNFGWLDAPLPKTSIAFIWAIEIVAFLGLFFFFFSKVPPPDFLPSRPVVLFCIGLLLALQFGIRFFDWRVFDATRELLSGTPGRYFLPTLIPHLLLIVTGLGYWMKTPRHFNLLTKTLALSMVLLFFHSTWSVIIPRYYL